MAGKIKDAMANKFKKYSIGIIGLGTVGGALENYFKENGAPLFVYDKNGRGSLDEVNKADVIFVCVPTPFNKKNGFDLSYVEDAFENILGRKIVVIKSTVLPGTTEKLQKKYPGHKILFNPEFLTERNAKNDMKFPDKQIVGFTSKSREIAENILRILPDAPFKKIVDARDAEMVKYFTNTFLASKVVFANQMYDLCKKSGIDYETVKKIVTADNRIGDSHLDIFFDGYRGYGGKCLPKDTRAIIHFADSMGVDLKLHKTVEEINNNLISGKKYKKCHGK